MAPDAPGGHRFERVPIVRAENARQPHRLVGVLIHEVVLLRQVVIKMVELVRLALGATDIAPVPITHAPVGRGGGSL